MDKLWLTVKSIYSDLNVQFVNGAVDPVISFKHNGDSIDRFLYIGVKGRMKPASEQSSINGIVHQHSLVLVSGEQGDTREVTVQYHYSIQPDMLMDQIPCSFCAHETIISEERKHDDMLYVQAEGKLKAFAGGGNKPAVPFFSAHKLIIMTEAQYKDYHTQINHVWKVKSDDEEEQDQDKETNDQSSTVPLEVTNPISVFTYLSSASFKKRYAQGASIQDMIKDNPTLQAQESVLESLLHTLISQGHITCMDKKYKVLFG